jgi:hypothetical protein
VVVRFQGLNGTEALLSLVGVASWSLCSQLGAGRSRNQMTQTTGAIISADVFLQPLRHARVPVCRHTT